MDSDTSTQGNKPNVTVVQSPTLDAIQDAEQEYLLHIAMAKEYYAQGKKHVDEAERLLKRIKNLKYLLQFE